MGYQPTGNFVKISAGTIASGTSNLIFDNIFNSTDGYNRYVLKIDDLYGSTDSQVRFRYRIFLTDSNTTQDDTDDHYSGFWMAATGSYDGSGIYASSIDMLSEIFTKVTHQTMQETILSLVVIMKVTVFL